MGDEKNNGLSEGHTIEPSSLDSLRDDARIREDFNHKKTMCFNPNLFSIEFYIYSNGYKTSRELIKHSRIQTKKLAEATNMTGCVIFENSLRRVL